MTALAAAATSQTLLTRLLPWGVGLAFALVFVPPGYLDGSAALLLQPQDDFLQHQAGIVAYLNDAWRWPPFHTRLANAPAGTSLVFTDSLPGPALLAKALQSATGLAIPLLGWWIFALYLLQPVAMARLLRAMAVRDWRPILAGSLIALACPWFLARFGHSALNAHFLLLFALAFAIESGRAADARKPLLKLTLLALGCLFVHAYLFAMVAALLFFAALGACAGRRLAWRAGLAGALFWAGLAAGLMALLGYFAFREPMGGYARFSMNLVSPFVPQMSGLWPDFGRLLWVPGRPPMGDWRDISHLRPYPPMGDVIDGTGGQYEGYAWFGFGLWPLLALAAWRARGKGAVVLRRHWALLLAVGGMALFALGPTVWVAYGAWFSMPPVPEFLTAFRSCGRFVWPLLYLGVAAAVAGVGAPPLRRWAVLALAGLTLVQLADARLWYDRLWRQLRAEPMHRFAAEEWRPFIALHARLEIQPPIGCRSDASEEIHQLVLHAAMLGIPSNSIQISLGGDRGCRAAAVRHLSLAPDEGTLLILLGRWAPMQHLALPDETRRLCRPIDGGYACTRAWARAEAAGAAPD